MSMMLISQASMKAIAKPKVREYTTFGESNSWIELL
jgi:hypothetical protein